ncbi:MAG TPA: ABC transporter permease subunit [Fulvivirga sp.]|nr:ABC transporter permease subunit [Fulvivirga sp.]
MIKIFKYSFFDLIRSRWSLIYFLFFAVTAGSLLYLSNDVGRAVVSLMNIIIILCPLIATMFGVMYYYNSREFIELLLAQPIRRESILLGQYFGLTISLTLSFVLGLGIPFLFYGILGSIALTNFVVLLLAGSLLTFTFVALAFVIAVKNENKIKGFSLAIFVWLFLAVLYDGLFLLSLFIFEDYPLDKFSLIMTTLNPIDLSRILIMLQLDVSALLGYTGAVFNKFFGTSIGFIVSLSCGLFWVIIPVLSMVRLAKRKDF